MEVESWQEEDRFLFSRIDHYESSSLSSQDKNTPMLSPVSVREVLTQLGGGGNQPDLSAALIRLEAIVLESSPAASRKRKTVKFSDIHQTLSSCCPTVTEKEQVWYSRGELREFKHDAKRCKPIWNENKNDFDVFYDTATATVTTSSMEQEGVELSKASLELAQSSLFNEYRGVEHLVSKALCLARSMTVLTAKTEFVLKSVAQSHLLHEGGGNVDTDFHVADQYAMLSQPAVRYARLVGLADAAVAASEEIANEASS
jgi:hypothetical protein